MSAYRFQSKVTIKAAKAINSFKNVIVVSFIIITNICNKTMYEML